MTLRIDPGNHPCSDKPDPGPEACRALHFNEGQITWVCPECKSRWKGEPDYAKVQGMFRYTLRWERWIDSSNRWKKAEIKRLEALMEH